MKKAVVGLLAAGVFLAGVGTAFAASWNDLGTREISGAVLTEGHYRFNPPERNHGSFEWEGSLRDKNAGDGHNGYVRVRVEGHDWVRYYGKQGKTVHLHHSNWEGSQRYTDDADLNVCVDNAALARDECSRDQHISTRR
ncbi:hypothetical protein [Streptomyces camelliae]|uniref:Uncharacterized protein n=1 Tax=Streptomyces camelliae TaxID=3004093 RepID=A0ABY7P7X4_9ACTN|nr:hypothetical protein [Streptomyces sp. HUAS 2-6]WBO66487.1 hypothetical protein O1G22_28620 [Streptomyces sp. HUAS 2-6]